MRPTPPAPRPSLLESLQELLERTYRMDTGVLGIGRFVIGDEGYRRLYGERGPEREAQTGVRAAGHAGGDGGARG